MPRTSATPGTPETPGTLLIRWECSSSGFPISLPCGSEIDIRVTGNNPQLPPFFPISNGGSQSVTLGPGNFVIDDLTFYIPPLFSTSYSGDCTSKWPASGDRYHKWRTTSYMHSQKRRFTSALSIINQPTNFYFFTILLCCVIH